MRAMYDSFPEVLQTDRTRKANKWFGQSRTHFEDITELTTPFVANIFKTEMNGFERPLSE
ncbi:hypothetical protein PInf_022092 [Phytophthora infestans]|nr:hypothetical protein PInf_022092 [Phytophthora infestans]